MTHPKIESWNSPISSDPTGETESLSSEQLVLFTVMECAKHGSHVIVWTPSIDPE